VGKLPTQLSGTAPTVVTVWRGFSPCSPASFAAVVAQLSDNWDFYFFIIKVFYVLVFVAAGTASTQHQPHLAH